MGHISLSLKIVCEKENNSEILDASLRLFGFFRGKATDVKQVTLLK